jgi:excisionase family DNA binding protein
MTEPLLVGVKEAGRRLGLGRDAAYALVREGRLRSVAVGRKRLVPVTELAAFVERESARSRESA